MSIMRCLNINDNSIMAEYKFRIIIIIIRCVFSRRPKLAMLWTLFNALFEH